MKGFVVLVLVLVAGCGPTQSPAQQLAAAGGGKASSYQAALDNLSGYCRESEQQLADEDVKSVAILQQHGDGESYLALLRDWYNSIPAVVQPGLNCTQVLAGYDVLRIDG